MIKETPQEVFPLFYAIILAGTLGNSIWAFFTGSVPEAVYAVNGATNEQAYYYALIVFITMVSVYSFTTYIEIEFYEKDTKLGAVPLWQSTFDFGVRFFLLALVAQKVFKVGYLTEVFFFIGMVTTGISVWYLVRSFALRHTLGRKRIGLSLAIVACSWIGYALLLMGEVDYSIWILVISMGATAIIGIDLYDRLGEVARSFYSSLLPPGRHSSFPSQISKGD